MNPCPACGTLNVSGTIACMRCGTPLAGAGEAPAIEPVSSAGGAPDAGVISTSSDSTSGAPTSAEASRAGGGWDSPAGSPAQAPPEGGGFGAPTAGGAGSGGGGPGWGAPPPSGGYGGDPYGAPLGSTGGAVRPPLDVGDTIKGAFDVCTANFKTFFLVQVLCAAPGWLVQTVGQVLQSYGTASAMSGTLGGSSEGPMTEMGMAGAAVSFVGLMVYGIGGIIAAGAMSRGVLDAMARRSVDDASALISFGVSRLGSVFLGGLLVGFVTGIGTLFCCVPGIFAGVVFCMTVPVIIGEGKSSTNAMERSFELSEGSRVEIFLTLLAYVCIVFVLFIPVGCIGGGVAVAAAAGAGAAIGVAIVSQVVSLVIGALYAMLNTALNASIYVRLSGHGAQTNSNEVAKVFA